MPFCFIMKKDYFKIVDIWTQVPFKSGTDILPQINFFLKMHTKTLLIQPPVGLFIFDQREILRLLKTNK